MALGWLKQHTSRRSVVCGSLLRYQIPSAVQRLPGGEKKEGPGGMDREPAPAAMQPPRRRRVELRAQGTGAVSAGRARRRQRAAQRNGRAPSPPLRTGPLCPPCLARPSPRFVSRAMRFSTALSTTTTTASYPPSQPPVSAPVPTPDPTHRSPSMSFPATENGKLSMKGRVAIITGAGNGIGRA